MKKFLFSLASAIITFQGIAQISIIPQPDSVNPGKGSFNISRKTVIAAMDEGDRKAAEFLNDYLQRMYGLRLDVDRKEGKDFIRLSTRKFIQAPEKDAYSLMITGDGVSIEGDTYAGTFHGVQTLLQLLPVMELAGSRNSQPAAQSNRQLQIPQLSIQDAPRFAYRGMHLDVSRHFFPVDFVKKYIDYLTYHKLNYFHWHLTDDQGWRIEIKRYPELVNKGSWRHGTIIGRYPGTGNDNKRYGGYYTHDEIREVVAYAADRFITVVPEIEMPGHASAAIAAYPYLSCFPGKPTKIPSHPSDAARSAEGKLVQETWGIFEDVFCAGNDSTFLFLEGVMDEVLNLFPSRYIHVGGDECPKVHWKECPRCQSRIRLLGLKDEHELQSYFIQRMEKYLNAKGRILVGWDEILEGGLAPNAIVMSWRGEKGGIEAAKQKHNVIMTPSTHVYFDYSQTKNEDSIVIGGYSPLEKVYSYEPLSKELSPDETKYILGAQANLWTEYIKYPSKVEYMVFPRMSALSEVLWSQPGDRSFPAFEKKLTKQFIRYDMWGAHYSKAYHDIVLQFKPGKSGGTIQLAAATKSKQQIRYTMNGGSTATYKAPVVAARSGDYCFFVGNSSTAYNRNCVRIDFHKGTGRKVSITAIPDEKYPGQSGAFSLLNGIRSNKGLSHPDWLGWIGSDMEASIDLGKSTSVSQVSMHTLDQNGSWVYLPEYVEVFASADGKTYRSLGRTSEFVKDTLTMGYMNVSFPKQNTRYLKVVAKNYGTIPSGKPGAGNKAWLFADELIIR